MILVTSLDSFAIDYGTNVNKKKGGWNKQRCSEREREQSFVRQDALPRGIVFIHHLICHWISQNIVKWKDYESVQSSLTYSLDI